MNSQAGKQKIKGAVSNASKRLTGCVQAPGDKSMSHRALILGALAGGTTKITGLLEGEDILHTVKAMRSFSAQVEQQKNGSWNVRGCGRRGWQSPDKPVDFGNAGTGARLIMGAAAGFDLKVRYIGDESLSARPMGRVLGPLREMGAKFENKTGRLPIWQTRGGALQAISYTSPHASAQVKSAILLASLDADGTTEVVETRPTRDHTENMFPVFGVEILRKVKGGANHISITGPAKLEATDITIPGDPSSAAFLVAAALITPGSDIIIENVMMNPTRTGFFEVLTEMGAYLRADNFRRSSGEIVADLHVRYSRLSGVTVPANSVPSMVDEYPILAVCAAFARGKTDMHGLAELRIKESDRLQGTCDLLTTNGVNCEIHGDRLHVTGGTIIPGGGESKTRHDHRLAMSALVLGLGSRSPVRIDDTSMIRTSFPNFFTLMKSLGANIHMFA